MKGSLAFFIGELLLFLSAVIHGHGDEQLVYTMSMWGIALIGVSIHIHIDKQFDEINKKL